MINVNKISKKLFEWQRKLSMYIEYRKTENTKTLQQFRENLSNKQTEEILKKYPKKLKIYCKLNISNLFKLENFHKKVDKI